MEDTITIKLPPLLADEVQYSVENWINDEGNRPAEQSFAGKVVKNARVLTLTLDEAAALHNELWSMEDKISEWMNSGDPDDLRWFGVHRSIKKKLAELHEFGVQVDLRGWAVV